MSVTLSVTLLQIASFLFLDGIEPFFGRHLSMWHSTKRCPSIFNLGPLTPKIYSGDVWAYQGVFGDGRFNGTMQNVVGPTLVAMATKFGLGAEIQSPTGLFLAL